MGFFSRFFAVARYGPSEPMSSPSGWFVRMIGGGKTKAGVPVSEYTALQLPVVYACVNRIANPISRFPLQMFRRLDDGSRRPVKAEEHPLARQLGVRPNEHMSSRTLRKTTQGHALLWGNGYIEIERNRGGQAVGLFPLLPDRTRPVREDGVYAFRTTIDGQSVRLEHDDVLHIMDQSQDGFVGISQIAMARQAIGMGLAMEEFGAKFFANDAKSGGFLMHPGRLGTQAKQNIRGENGEKKAAPDNPAAGLEAQGGLDNAHRVKVLEEGMKFISTTIPPEDAQFLGSREFQIAEVARIFDVPLVLLQSHERTTSWGSGIEQLMIGFLRSTIEPWIDAWEQEMNWKLFTPEEIDRGFYVKFNMKAMLRGDMKARADFYAKLFGVGGFSPNRILELEDEDGIGDIGDFHFVPANFVTLERATDPNQPPPSAPGAPTADPEPSNDEAGDPEPGKDAA
jgi:HK97 family phage portal protein